MAEQERSGPTPAQVEALARVKMKRWGYSPETFAYSALIPHALNEAASDLDAIEAGEVPGVFTATDEPEWRIVAAFADGRFPATWDTNEESAQTMGEQVASAFPQDIVTVERRWVGRWEPVGEEQDHD